MFELVAGVGGGLFVLASLIVGGRIMWMARRTRGLPELVLGAALFLMGGIGYPLMMAAVNGHALADSTRSALVAGQIAANLVGMGGICWFTMHIFRPRVAWAKALWLGLSGLYVGLAAAQVLGSSLIAFANSPETGPWYISNYAGIVVMSWAGIESLRYWGMQKKRLALGLADPVVADRFRLWGVAILTATSITVISSAFQLAGVNMIGTASGSLVIGVLGLVASATLGLAFMPTQGYIERVRRCSPHGRVI